MCWIRLGLSRSVTRMKLWVWVRQGKPLQIRRRTQGMAWHCESNQSPIHLHNCSLPSPIKLQPVLSESIYHQILNNIMHLASKNINAHRMVRQKVPIWMVSTTVLLRSRLCMKFEQLPANRGVKHKWKHAYRQEKPEQVSSNCLLCGFSCHL